MTALNPGSPEASGMSGAALQRIDDHLKRRYIDAGRFPGTQLMVYRRGNLVHNSVQGFADLERRVALKDDTIFRIYSMTKPITSVAFMMLVEQGLVALDEPVHKYIPEWKNLGVFQAGTAPAFMTKPPTRPMQIIDLLRHTSGLTYGFQQRTNVDAAYRDKQIGTLDPAGTLDSMIASLADIPLEFSPGEAWNYSVSTDVIGYLVGKISGISFEQFLKERIFDPLGMADTDFFVPADKAQRLAACYNATVGGMMSAHSPDAKSGLTLQDDPAKSPFLSLPSFISGGGGLCSTAADYLTFCQALLNGGVRLIGPKTLALMTTNHLPGNRDLPDMSRSMFAEATYAGIGFGLGFSVTMDPAKTLIAGSPGEYAWGGAATTSFWIDPAEDLITIFMTQVIPSSAYPIRRELRTMVYAAITDANL
ncbi:CubicO group peptidase (beta-lactamase class C family) [Nitrobacter vulgaris]|jgi:CubicO group peptidase (beta-lactamase class C family)|uniref:serine hydrolase domain-containing protein n=1 Tax=Nitrobacter vulgaris TaxID=29421 RepID=UPI002857C46D|nr:serine hydrolase domain-containing protein [Nitrobacter vulgaris]MDR6303587.1 CubicO group peptidase (beta-lactamase class C family) [Nitrobacter vulgaris]